MHDEGDGPTLSIVIGDGQWNPLTLFINSDNNKLARLGFVSHSRSPNLIQLGNRGQILFGQDFVHAYASLHSHVAEPLPKGHAEQIITPNPSSVKNGGETAVVLPTYPRQSWKEICRQGRSQNRTVEFPQAL